MKISAMAMFKLGRLYAQQTGLKFWTLEEQLFAIKLFLLAAKTNLL